MDDVILNTLCLFILGLTIFTVSEEHADYISIGVLGVIICTVLAAMQPAHAGLDILSTRDINVMISVFFDINAVIWNGVGSFFWLAGSAVGMGLGMGYGFSFIYKKLQNVEFRMIANVVLLFLTFFIASLPVLPSNQPLSSGYVAVFIAGFVFGRQMLKNEEEHRCVHKIWIYLFKFCEITYFMILGVLVRPNSFLTVLGPALVLVCSIMIVTRPLQIFTYMAKTDLKVKDKLFIASMGLKGLDPAVLAIAAFESVGTLTNPHVNGVNLLINFTFTLFPLVTVGLSLMLTLLYWKKVSRTARP